MSYLVSTVLECLGYGKDQRLKRKDLYKQIDEKRNKDAQPMFTFITVGSKGEGLTNVFEKDRDMLVIESSGICVDKYYDTSRPPNDDKNVFTLNMDNSPPGHGLHLLTGLGSCSAIPYLTSTERLYSEVKCFSKLFMTPL